MHVLIIPSWYPVSSIDIGGSFFREQAIALKNSGCAVGVIALEFNSLKNVKWLLKDNYSLTFECDHGVNTYRKRYVNLFPRLYTAQAKLWEFFGLKLFRRYVDEQGVPDIVHVHSMLYAGAIAKEISIRYDIPYVVTEHSTLFARKMVNPVQREIAQKIAIHAEKRFAVSSVFAVLLEKFLGGNVGEWEVMPNIVHERFLFNSTKDSANGFTFLNVSFLTYKKGVDLLIDAFAKAFKGCSQIKLQIAGDGEQRALLEALTVERGVAAQVEFLGLLEREGVVAAISAANALVLSSRYETFGVVLIEALAMGRPVVATRCGGPEDIVRKEDGILVAIDDIDELAAGMKSLYENYAFYQPQEIRKACRLRYGEKVVTDRLLNVYRGIVSIHLAST